MQPCPVVGMRKRRNLWRIAVGVSLVCALPACNRSQTSLPSSATARPEVSVVTLQPQSVQITAELPGRTTASLVAEVRPQVTGIIQSRLFDEGSEVKAGQALYQIDPATYVAATDSAKAALQKAEAAVPTAEAKLARQEVLIKTNAVSQQTLDDTKAALAVAKADVAAASANLKSAEINLDYTKIMAPIDGRIDKSTLTPGALVTASQATALTTIRKLDPINVDVTQSSTNLLNLRQAIAAGRVKLTGDNVRVRLKLENGAIYPHLGTLAFSESNVSESTGTFGMRAAFPNPDRLLLPGMYVRAIVEEGVSDNSFLVPQRAVSRNTKGEPIAVFADKDGRIEQRVLTVSRTVGNNWLVESGVGAGDRVLVEGTQLVRVGQLVTPVEVSIDETTGEVRERGAERQSKRTTDFADNVRDGKAVVK